MKGRKTQTEGEKQNTNDTGPAMPTEEKVVKQIELRSESSGKSRFTRRSRKKDDVMDQRV